SRCTLTPYLISLANTQHTTFEGRLIIASRVQSPAAVRASVHKGDEVMMEQSPSLFAGQPDAQGLYDPRHEHDACGVGFVVNIKGVKSHAIVRQGLQTLINLLHRGACGCEVNTGDGAGILIQVPDRFFRREGATLGIALPAPGDYGTGRVFLPTDLVEREKIRSIVQAIGTEEGQHLLGWRDVPTDDSHLGATARSVEPHISQMFVGRGAGVAGRASFERKLYVVRKRIEIAVDALDSPQRKFFYVPSLSA